MSRASVGDLQALDDLIAGLPDMQRESIERAIDHRTQEPARASIDGAYTEGWNDGRRFERAESKKAKNGSKDSGAAKA